MKTLIIGCPRSGTRYTAEAAKALGLNLGHEKEGDDGMVNWKMALDTSGFDIILHQVRHPLPCISSIAHVLKEISYRILCSATSASMEDDPLLRAMKIWVEWNEMCRKKAMLTYRVESLEKMFPMVKTNENHRDHERHTLSDMMDQSMDITNHIQYLARLYGYKL